MKDPVVIGGVGGSGTRLVADCLQEMGYFIGHDLNHTNDNLWFTLLFKRMDILSTSDEQFTELLELFTRGMSGANGFTPRQQQLARAFTSIGRDQHPSAWLEERAESLLAKKPLIDLQQNWGWKEPNTHIVLDRLYKNFSNMKYIHVARNGLDLAYSRNQHQLDFWGQHFIGNEVSCTPYYSLKYWCIIHQRVQSIAERMGGKFLLLNYDDFCYKPETGLKILGDFLEIELDSNARSTLLGQIEKPDSIGRFRTHGIDAFDQKDIDYVQQLGFDVSTDLS